MKKMRRSNAKELSFVFVDSGRTLRMYTTRQFNSRHAVIFILFLCHTFGPSSAQRASDKADKKTIDAIKRLILDRLGMKSEPVIDKNTIELSVKDHVKSKMQSKMETSKHTVSKVSITPTKTGKNIFEFDFGSTGIYMTDAIYSAFLNIKLTTGITKNKSFNISQDGKVLFQSSLSEKDWISKNVTRNLVNWIQHKSNSLTKPYVLDIKREFGEKAPSTIYLDVEYINRKPQRSPSNECHVGQTTCCRKRVRVNLRDFSWIFKPDEIDIFYCDGSCETKSYGRFLSALIANYKFASCCIATKFSNIRMIYIDETKNLYEKEVPGIDADECACNGYYKH
ncbi:uncharacterized protein LOC130646089 [Hydractinia symbiolongicarpus]|uniref:uncharacterized protein LOC130646089 n=1 Tax=Hydractinia symbiolongicarpus TaxID=13093 RepID=UPI00254B82DA|nr:uncharacterized protein LOC130646089 [Hydractinia symbiolongicarpus]